MTAEPVGEDLPAPPPPDGGAPRIVVFAPSPVLTVTVEDHPEEPDIHVHAGGQGIWQARMLLGLGIRVSMCSVLSGEAGRILRHLIADEGIDLHAIERSGRGAAYVHDRRGGAREAIAESGGEPLTRHDVDELYGLMLREGLEAGTAILSGPAGEDALPADVYRRLAADLRTNGARVIVDLAGERLAAALEGGVDVAKVSHEELLADGRIEKEEPRQIISAMREMAEQGASAVIVTRAGEPFLVYAEGTVQEVRMPKLEIADPKGAGDSLTAGVAAALAEGSDIWEAVCTGAAAGALNVTRHGLGTGEREAIAKLRELVVCRPTDGSPEATDAEEAVSPQQLARRVVDR